MHPMKLLAMLTLVSMIGSCAENEEDSVLPSGAEGTPQCEKALDRLEAAFNKDIKPRLITSAEAVAGEVFELNPPHTGEGSFAIFSYNYSLPRFEVTQLSFKNLTRVNSVACELHINLDGPAKSDGFKLTAAGSSTFPLIKGKAEVALILQALNSDTAKQTTNFDFIFKMDFVDVSATGCKVVISCNDKVAGAMRGEKVGLMERLEPLVKELLGTLSATCIGSGSKTQCSMRL